MKLREKFEKLHPVPLAFELVGSQYELRKSSFPHNQNVKELCIEYNHRWYGFKSGYTAGIEDAKKPKEPITIKPPFQRELTVVMLPERGDKEADAAIAAIQRGATVFIIDPPEQYFHQLRLRVAQDSTLEKRIAVFYQRPDNILQEIGLKFEDELKWPIDFLHMGWNQEMDINEAREQKRKETIRALVQE